MFRSLILLGFAIIVARGCHDKKRRRRDVGALNLFFDTCMASNSINDFTWASVVDFVIEHGSWYDGESLQCTNGGDFSTETDCWLNALESLLTEPDLDVAKGCVCDYLYETNGVGCSSAQRNPSVQAPQTGPVLNDENCPYVSDEEYASRLADLIAENNLTLNDRTSIDLLSIVKFVRTEGVCLSNCTCDLNYTSTANASESLSCESCWPTRLHAMFKQTSPLKQLARNVTLVLETAGAVQPTSIECNYDGVAIHIADADMDYASDDRLVMSNEVVYDASSVEAKCVGSSNNNFNVGFADCEVQISKNETHFEFTFTIWKVRVHSEVVARFTLNYTCLTCVYTRQVMIESQRLLPMLRLVKLNGSLEQGRFLTTIGFYDDIQFANKLPQNSMVKVPDCIYVNIEMHLDGAYVTEIIDCWATDQPGNNTSRIYHLITSGTARTDELNGSPVVEIIQNGFSSSARFKFRSFVWSGDIQAAIFVKCRVRACNPAMEDCNENSDKKKRSLLSSENMLTVSSGAILVAAHTRCLEGNGGCSDLCDDTVGEVVCNCFGGRKLGRNRLTCYDDYSHNSQAEKSVGSVIVNPTITIMLLIIIVVLLFVIITKQNGLK